ncbi:MAG: hypothetical protein U0S12_11670 [Fimbriimonadales bacterium]
MTGVRLITCNLTKLETALEATKKAYPKLKPTDAALVASALTLTGRHAIAIYDGTQYTWPEDYEKLTGAVARELEWRRREHRSPEESEQDGRSRADHRYGGTDAQPRGGRKAARGLRQAQGVAQRHSAGGRRVRLRTQRPWLAVGARPRQLGDDRRAGFRPTHQDQGVLHRGRGRRRTRIGRDEEAVSREAAPVAVAEPEPAAEAQPEAEA